MTVSGIEAVGFTPFVAPAVPASAVTPPDGGAALTGVDPMVDLDFASMLSTGIERLEGLHDRADGLAVQAATGELANLHDYTVAATEASVATQLTTAVRNKALEAFQEIMRMPI